MIYGHLHKRSYILEDNEIISENQLFTLHSFLYCLLLASFYPILAALINSLSTLSLNLAGIELMIFESNIMVWGYFAILLLNVWYVLLWGKFPYKSDYSRLFFWGTSFVFNFFFVGLVFDSFSLAVVLAIFVAIVVAVDLAGAVILVGAFAGALSFVLAGSVSFVIAPVFAFFIALCVAFFVAFVPVVIVKALYGENMLEIFVHNRALWTVIVLIALILLAYYAASIYLFGGAVW